jgi:RND family efflux transporter MFP subunit
MQGMKVVFIVQRHAKEIMKNRRAGRSGAALLAFAVLMSATTTPTAIAQDPRAPVVVALAQQQPLRQELQLTGTVTAQRSANLSVATSGLVQSIAVDAGDRVAAGDLLLELDAELARYQWQSAEAAQLQARSALQDAQRRLEEARTLSPQRSIAETVVRDLAAEVLEDEAALQSAAALASYQRGVLERHRLRAPFDGVISMRQTELGEWVTPGAAVLGLVATDKLRIDAQVPEDYLNLVNDNTRFSVSLADDRERRYPARLAALVPVTDPAARTFLLRVVPVDAVAAMRPGMSARVNLDVDEQRNGVVVPRDALLRLADGRVVVWVVVDSQGTLVASERVVTTGLRFNGLVEITDGLEAGSRVVVRGNESLREGQPLQVRELGQR